MASLEPKQPPSDEDGNVIVVPINREFSDGTQNSWPTDPKFRMTDDTAYRRKLAAKWIEENGAYEPGMYLLIFHVFIRVMFSVELLDWLNSVTSSISILENQH